MSVNLLGSINVCRVDTAWADKVQSDRFLNPGNMICPVWTGMDLTGRRVSPDSFVTKTAGCNSALDRTIVENAVTRPQYMEYVTLSANGIQGSIYGDESVGVTNGPNSRENFSLPKFQETVRANKYGYPSDREACVNGTAPYQKCVGNVNNITGNFGLQLSKNTQPSCGMCNYNLGMSQMYPQYATGLNKGSCGSYPYQSTMAQFATDRRKAQSLNEGFYNHTYKRNSGF